MPRVAEINGVLIAMYFRDHNPPHVHVKVGGDDAVVAIADGAVLKGAVSAQALATAQAFIANNRAELLARWNAYQKR